MNTLEAYDLVVFAAQTHEKLMQAERTLESKPGASSEKTWMASAQSLLGDALIEAKPLLEKAKALPDLRPIREESTSEVIGVWVDALEKLHAGITFHAGSRTPLLQALFTHTKWPALRKATFEGAEEYARELTRRLKTSYVERMIALEEFAFAKPIVDQARASFEAVAATRADVKMPEEEARKLTEDVLTCAQKIELLLFQSKLLAQAALAPFPGVFDEAGLSAKPKKRAVKAAEAPVAEDEVASIISDEDVEVIEASDSEGADASEKETPVKPARAKRAKSKTDASEATGGEAKPNPKKKVKGASSSEETAETA